MEVPKLQVGDVFVREWCNEIRIIRDIKRFDGGELYIYYDVYSKGADGKWDYSFSNEMSVEFFNVMFGAFKVSKLKAILLKSLIEKE